MWRRLPQNLTAPARVPAGSACGRSVLRGLLALAVGVAAYGPRDLCAEGHSYYSYTDEQGVLHITNVPRAGGGWTLYRQLSGSGHRSSRSVGALDRTSQTPAERLHRYDVHIEGAAARYQLPESLVRAVIHTESNYNASAVSSAGAMGLMQLMPSTAQYLGVRQAFDPRENIYGGARFLRLLANRYSGDMVLVLAAYNAGPGSVEKYGGVPPFAETRAYVRAVLRRYYAYERLAPQQRSELRRGPARNIAP